MNKRIFLNLLPAFLCALAIAGCTSRGLANSAPMAEYNIQIGSSAPVHGKELTLKNKDKLFYSPVGGGSLSGGWEKPNFPQEAFDGAHIGLIGKNIVPSTAYAYWFSYQNQKYYQAEINLSAELSSLIEAHAKAFGENTSEPTLVFVLGPNGEMKSALKSSCSRIYICGRNEKTTVIGSGVGKEAPGDPKVYLQGAIKRIKEGEIEPIPGIEE